MKKFKNYAFWVALAGAIVVFLENLESMLGVSIDESLVESLILSFCGILVVLGIVTKSDDDTVDVLPDQSGPIDVIEVPDDEITSTESVVDDANVDDADNVNADKRNIADVSDNKKSSKDNTKGVTKVTQPVGLKANKSNRQDGTDSALSDIHIDHKDITK